MRLKLTKEGKVSTKGNEKEIGYPIFSLGYKKDFTFRF